MVYSLLGHLIIVTCCVLYLFLESEKVHGSPGAQLEISSKVRWKKHTFFGRWECGGILRALTKKIYPVLFLHSGTPLGQCKQSLGCTKNHLSQKAE